MARRNSRTRYMKMDSCFAVALDAHWTCKDEVKSAESRESQCYQRSGAARHARSEAQRRRRHKDVDRERG